MEIADLTPTNRTPDEALYHIDKCGTLLRAAGEAADEASHPEGYWFRNPGYERERLMHVRALIDLVDDELDRLRRLMGAGA